MVRQVDDTALSGASWRTGFTFWVWICSSRTLRRHALGPRVESSFVGGAGRTGRTMRRRNGRLRKGPEPRALIWGIYETLETTEKHRAAEKMA